jgi:hypothetical protein
MQTQSIYYWNSFLDLLTTRRGRSPIQQAH